MSKKKTADIVDLTQDLIRRFRALEQAQKDLDFAKAAWARDAVFALGGEEKFAAWCKSNLGCKDTAVNDLLTFARAIAVVSDTATWNKLGTRGKASGRALATVVKERMPAPPATVTPIKKPTVKGPLSDVILTGEEAAILGKYVRELRNVPNEVMVIVERMWRARRKAA